MCPFHLIPAWLARNVDCNNHHGFVYGETMLINEFIRHKKHYVFVEREKLSLVLFRCMRHPFTIFQSAHTMGHLLSLVIDYGSDDRATERNPQH